MLFYPDSNQVEDLYNDAERTQQKLCNLGRMTAGVAHDLNNLLSGMLSIVDLLQEEATPEIQSRLFLLEATINRAEELTDGLLSLLRESPLPPEPINPCPYLKELCLLLEKSFDSKLYYIINDPVPLRTILMHKAKLGQVLLNLMVNANEAAGTGGIVTVDARFEENSFLLKVSDNGPGLSQEQCGKIFSPFFSTGKGTGLGLAIVKSLVDEVSGKISLESSPGNTIFSIRFPEYKLMN